MALTLGCVGRHFDATPVPGSGSERASPSRPKFHSFGRLRPDEFVPHIALAWLVTRVGDAAFDRIEGQVEDGSRLGNDVLFDHQTAHVVGSEHESHLADLLALGDPRRLNVRDVVEVQPSHSLGLEVLKRTRFGQLRHIDATRPAIDSILAEPGGGLGRLVRPADECREPVRLVLEIA